MKQRIQELRGGPGDSQVDPSTPFCKSPDSALNQGDDAPDNGLRSETPDLGKGPASEPCVRVEELALKNKKGFLNWVRRLLLPDPAEPRKSQRESLSWLIAYFFTGGTPVAHLVRDVSFTGMYVFTEERWYLGTVVRITLSDRRHPTAERSLTLNARVVRWGDDGVGLQFLLQDGKGRDSALIPTLGDSLDPIGRRQLEQYLERLKTGTS